MEQLAPLLLPVLGGWFLSISKRNDAVTTAWTEDRAELKKLREDHDQLQKDFYDLKDKFDDLLKQLDDTSAALIERERTIASQAAKILNLELENANLKAAGATPA